MKKFLKVVKNIICFVLILVAVFLLSIVLINVGMVVSTAGNIKDLDTIASENDYDCAIVLGCSVRPDKTPSDMLRARLDAAFELYEKTGCRIIVSGDHEDQYYNEVKIMKEYLVDKGIPSEKIYMDHAGYSTYDSMYRLKNIFGVNKAVVITQRYHLYRALSIAKILGIEVAGLEAEDVTSGSGTENYLREIAARPKALFDSVRRAAPRELGEKIDLNQSGDLTDEV